MKRTIQTVAGRGLAGFADGEGLRAALSEPGGLCEGPEGTVFVADTNNQVVRIYDLKSRNLTTLQLTDVPGPRKAATAEPETQQQVIPPGATSVSIEAQKVWCFCIDLSLAKAIHLDITASKA